MTTRTTEAQIIRAFVQTVRAQNAAFEAMVATVGVHTAFHGIHEGVAPPETEYPFLTYQMVYAPYDDDRTKRIIRAGVDLSAWSDNAVEASNLDQLATQVIEDQLAPVNGQTTLYARRISGIRLPEIDEKGDRIYRVGGQYEIWTDQTLL